MVVLIRVAGIPRPYLSSMAGTAFFDVVLIGGCVRTLTIRFARASASLVHVLMKLGFVRTTLLYERQVFVSVELFSILKAV